MKNIVYIVFLTLTLLAKGSHVHGQTDSIPVASGDKASVKPAPYHKNVIKFNPTPMLLFSQTRNITFSYERMVKKDQSVAIQVGYLLFPRLLDDTVVNLLTITDRSRKGINIALDYRYYPLSRNRRPAPDGLYLGGYISYYGFSFHNKFDILYATADQNGKIEGSFNFLNVGASLGYQFIFWKRFSLDLLLFGPSVSYYHRDIKISGELDQDQVSNIDEEVLARIMDRFPALKTIFSEKELSLTGGKAQFSVGFRYSIQFGFHF